MNNLNRLMKLYFLNNSISRSKSICNNISEAIKLIYNGLRSVNVRCKPNSLLLKAKVWKKIN